MKLPPLRASSVTATRAPMITAFTLSPKISSYAAATSSGAMSISSRNASPRPAFATNVSSLPHASTVASTARRLPSTVVTSAFTPMTAAPCCARASSRHSCTMSTTATRAPSSTKRSTTARPMPDPPPVTSATSFSSEPILRPLRCLEQPVDKHQHGAVLDARRHRLERLRRRPLQHVAVRDVELRAVHRALQLAAAAQPHRSEPELRMGARPVPRHHPRLGACEHAPASLDLVDRHEPEPEVVDCGDRDVLTRPLHAGAIL